MQSERVSAEVNTEELIVVAKFGAPHGVRGWLRIYSYTEPVENLFALADWRILDKSLGSIELKVEEYKPHQKCYVVKLAGVETREHAGKFTNKLVQVDRSALPPLEAGEFYWNDLLGFKVINQLSEDIGTISYFINAGANDIVAVKNKAGKEILLPFVFDDYVLEINEAEQFVKMQWDNEY